MLKTRKIPAITVLLLLAIFNAAIFGIGSSRAVPGSLEGIQGTSPLVGIVDVSKLPPASKFSTSIPIPSTSAANPNGLGPLIFRTNRPEPGGAHIGTGFSRAEMTTLSSVSSSSVYTSTGFDGLIQYQSCTCLPPDVEVATGPNHVFEMVNLAGEIFTKAGTPVRNFTLSSFFNTGSDFISDPKLIFDSLSNRWFASVIDNTGVKLAVSTTDDPNGFWRFYAVDAGPGNLADQPIIGISDSIFLVSVNVFGSSYLGARWWALNKNDVISGASARLTSFGPFSNLESVHPVQSLSSTPTQYMVSVGAEDIGAGSSSVVLFSVNGIPPDTTTTSVSLAVQPISCLQIGSVCAADQPGGADVSTVDFRVMDASWFEGLLWMGLNDKCRPSGDTADRSCIRLIQIDTPVQTVTQDFDHSASGQHFFFPSLGIDNQGDLIVFYGYSSSSIHPSIAVTGQSVNDPFGSLAPAVTVKLGNVPGGEEGRYGDYFGAAADPSDPTVIWGAGQYQTSSTETCDLFGFHCWSTFISRASFFDYSISASPTSVSFDSGSSGQSTVTVTSLNGFTGTINLTTAVSPSTGLTGSCSPASVNVGGAFQTANSLCTFTSSSPGIYSVTVAGASGPRLHSTALTVTVGGLGISASPSVFSIAAGSTATSTVTIRSFGSFSGTVSLSAPITPVVTGGPTDSISPASVSLSPGQTATSTLTISTTTSTAKGVYTVNVTATGSQVRYVLLPLAVTPFSVAISNTVTFTGITVQTTGTLSVDSQPTITITISGTPSVVASSGGQTLFSRTYSVQKKPIWRTEALFLLPIFVSPYALSSDLDVIMAGTTASAAVVVTRNLDINNNGLVDQPDLDTTAAAFGCSQGQACYNAQADINADSIVNIVDLATLGRYWMSASLIPDFTITANPASLTLPYASSKTSLITLTSINGFTGTVALSTVVYRGGVYAPYSGLGTSLSSTSITLSQGGTGSSTLTVSSNVAAHDSLIVKATSGSITRYFTISVNVLRCTRNCPQ